MNRVVAETEVMHCVKYYLRDTMMKCPNDYYRKRRADVLVAAREVLVAPCYEVLVENIEEMEAKENA